MLELIFHVTRPRSTLSYLYSRLFSALVYALPAGEFRWGRKQVKKTLATIFLMAMPAAGLAIEPLQNGSQETATTSAGSSAAKSHHSTHHKRSTKAHHKSQKHHTSKQHTQPQ
jgi:hypothetical protein